MYKDAIKFFGRFGTQHFGNYLMPLKEEITKSNLAILFELYVGKMLFMAAASFVVVIAFTVIYAAIFNIPLWVGMLSGIVIGTTVALIVLTIFHSYPFQLLTAKQGSIEGHMPFAINHMAAIAASGVPPFILFKLLSEVPEYGEITNEATRIVRNIEVFGMDINSAIKNVAERTPHDPFRQFLHGIVSTVETGGDLRKYFENAAKDAMFDYRLKREKHLQTLSTYADFYTAVLIAAPLFFVSILAVMALIGGQVSGLSIPDAMAVGVYFLIPFLNIMFLIFIHVTQPKV